MGFYLCQRMWSVEMNNFRKFITGLRTRCSTMGFSGFVASVVLSNWKNQQLVVQHFMKNINHLGNLI